MKRTVRDLMRQQELLFYPHVLSHASVREALRTLEIAKSGALLVIDKTSLRGIFSERDFARNALFKEGELSLDSPITQIMSRKIVYVTPDYRLEECLAVMSKMHVRHLPVMEKELPIALLSMRHIMEALIEDREFMLNELVRYVTGSSVTEKVISPEVLIRSLPRL